MNGPGRYVLAPRWTDSDEDSEDGEIANSHAGNYRFLDDLQSGEFGAEEVVETAEGMHNVDARLERVETFIKEFAAREENRAVLGAVDDWGVAGLGSAETVAAEVGQATGETANDRLVRIEAYMRRMAAREKERKDDHAALVTGNGGGQSSRDKVSQSSSGTIANLRWDNMPKFPPNVASNRMWESWKRFMDNFEIAASLSRVDSPVALSQLLYLNMGDQLQAVVRAAGLRPDLKEPDCYTSFVNAVGDHLKAMTDITAEHDASSSMQQLEGETVVSFHARLTEKARLCDYSAVDQERFVLAQLLKGMKNRDLAKVSRMLGHDANAIVKAATREEAYSGVAESKQSAMNESSSNVSAINRNPFNTRRRAEKRKGFENRVVSAPNKFRARNPSRVSRRNRCKMCNYASHNEGETCPAATRNCRNCGKLGHFASTCRQKHANVLEEDFADESKPTSEEQV